MRAPGSRPSPARRSAHATRRRASPSAFGQGSSIDAFNADGLTRLGLALNQEQLQALRRHCALVERWNPVASLVGAADVPRLFPRHVLDSLSLVPALAGRNGAAPAPENGWPAAGGIRHAQAPPRLADFGSGAGLPGIPLAIALPWLAVTLIERNAKKCRFLRRARSELALPNLQVRQGDFRETPPGSFNFVAARAVLPPPALWRQARAALIPGGSLLALDRVTRAPPTEASGDGDADAFPGGSLERRWVEMPALKAWHGILKVRKH